MDPEPGTCIIFPSFLPHFVLPLDAAPTAGMNAPEGAGAELVKPLRLSVAFNFGACEPVLLHLWLRSPEPMGGDNGHKLPQVKVLLEVVKDVY